MKKSSPTIYRRSRRRTIFPRRRSCRLFTIDYDYCSTMPTVPDIHVSFYSSNLQKSCNIRNTRTGEKFPVLFELELFFRRLFVFLDFCRRFQSCRRNFAQWPEERLSRRRTFDPVVSVRSVGRGSLTTSLHCCGCPKAQLIIMWQSRSSPVIHLSNYSLSKVKSRPGIEKFIAKQMLNRFLWCGPS